MNTGAVHTGRELEGRGSRLGLFMLRDTFTGPER